MKIDNLGKLPGIKADLIPPKCGKTHELAEPVGHTADGRTIYHRWVLDRDKYKKNRVPVMNGETGEPIFRKYADGSVYPVMRSEPIFREQRFVLERHDGGHVYVVEHFEATPEERAADRAKRDRNEFLEKLADQATTQGLSVDQLVGAVLKNAGVDPVEDTMEEEAVGAVEAPEFPVHRGGGNYVLSDGSKFKGNREQAEAAEEALLGAPT